MRIRIHNVILAALCVFGQGVAQQNKRQNPPDPTYANVPYGDHPQQILDFWDAGPGPNLPLAVFIHGGGFTGGSKDKINASTIKQLLSSGIHVASVEYRLIKHAKFPAQHEDAARAIQFLRSKSKAWAIDKNYIGGFGGSAGADLVAYLAWHDDRADPDSEDPIARESTRLSCVAPMGAQSTLDLNWWIENIPGYDKAHVDLTLHSDLEGEARDELLQELSIINLISSDDPPVYLRYGMRPDDPIPDEKARGWSIHHVNFGIHLEEKLSKAGVEVTLDYPGPDTRFSSVEDFLIEHLAWRSESNSYTAYIPITYTSEAGETLDYHFLEPRNYDPQKNYPLVLFLHGSGGRGPAGIRHLIDAGVPAYLATDEVHGKYDAFYVVPQCPGPNSWSRCEKLEANKYARPQLEHLLHGLTDEIIDAYPIDRSRLYVTGLSMGGEGTYGQVFSRPDFWAAAVPVCGKWAAEDVKQFSDIPLWLFHGALDTAVKVEYSRDMVNALKTNGGNVKYTEYPDVKHNSWIQAYRDPKLWKWLFAQKR
jgi:predicted peptidase